MTSMTNGNDNSAYSLTHTSVDCVVLSFDEGALKVLLLRRHGDGLEDMKLPGSIIYLDEDLDDAASRVLEELTGVKDVNLFQFRAFGSRNRTSNPKDIAWLEREQHLRVERIVTVAYAALLKMTPELQKLAGSSDACWVPLDRVPALAFDHNIIIEEAIKFVRSSAEQDPSFLFRLLPKKFTASQLKALMEAITGRELDSRNFYKKLSSMLYVVPTGEKERGVAHRAALLYRFDKGVFARSRM